MGGDGGGEARRRGVFDVSGAWSSILQSMQSTAAPMRVAQKNRAVQNCMKAVARATREVEQRIGQTEVRVVPDTAACRRANWRVWSCLESVDGGSGGMSTWRWCCV